MAPLHRSATSPSPVASHAHPDVVLALPLARAELLAMALRSTLRHLSGNSSSWARGTRSGVARWAPDDATDRAPSRDFRDFRRRAGVARTGSEWRDALKQQRLIGAAPIVPLATRPRQHERSSYSYLLGTMLKVSEREDMLLPPPVRGIVSSRMQLSPAYTLRDYTELE